MTVESLFVNRAAAFCQIGFYGIGTTQIGKGQADRAIDILRLLVIDLASLAAGDIALFDNVIQRGDEIVERVVIVVLFEIRPALFFEC